MKDLLLFERMVYRASDDASGLCEKKRKPGGIDGERYGCRKPRQNGSYNFDTFH